jgi:catalase
LDEQGKKNLVNNFTGAMKGIDGPKKDEIINRMLCHFFRADIGFGMAMAQALGINPEAAMPKEHAPEAAK